MNYIGSKRTLLGFIEKSIEDVTGGNYSSVCDLFAGTGVVGRHFKKLGKSIYSNDIQYYSYVLNRNYIENRTKLEFRGILEDVPGLIATENKYSCVCNYLSNIKGIEGFIFDNYCLGGSGSRMYYSDENGKKCDAVRQTIEQWHNEKKISDDEYFFLLCSLLESIDKVANTASVYGAFLKRLKGSAMKKLEIAPAEILLGTKDYKVFNDDANSVVRKIKADVLYLDPPYNQRQYATNYHLLETIAKYDNPDIHGKTGLRNYSSQKSAYCSRALVKDSFRDLVENANVKYIFLSYNNEGLMTPSDVRKIMSIRGEYGCFEEKYQRYKADSGRDYSAKTTTEYLHFVKCA